MTEFTWFFTVFSAMTQAYSASSSLGGQSRQRIEGASIGCPTAIEPVAARQSRLAQGDVVGD
jgi:hypothetical protein